MRHRKGLLLNLKVFMAKAKRDDKTGKTWKKTGAREGALALLGKLEDSLLLTLRNAGLAEKRLTAAVKVAVTEQGQHSDLFEFAKHGIFSVAGLILAANGADGSSRGGSTDGPAAGDGETVGDARKKIESGELSDWSNDPTGWWSPAECEIGRTMYRDPVDGQLVTLTRDELIWQQGKQHLAYMDEQADHLIKGRNYLRDLMEGPVGVYWSENPAMTWREIREHFRKEHPSE